MKNNHARHLKNITGCNHRAFTMIESMIAVLIFCLMVAVIYALYLQGAFSFYSSDTSIEVTENARKAMDAMIKELVNSSDSQCIPATVFSVNDSLVFRTVNLDGTGDKTWSDQVTYYRGGVSNSQLIRSQSGSNKVLCSNLETNDADGNGIIGVRFDKATTATGSIITITLQTRKQSLKGNVLAATVVNKVKLRN